MTETENPPSYKILLADDVPMNLQLASKLLKKRGHQVVAVEDGKQAVDAYNKEGFDAILMDMQMPVMDGIEATQKIRELEAAKSKEDSSGKKYHIPIIAVSANEDPTSLESYQEMGIDAYIAKPINIKTVSKTIQQIIEKVQGEA